jgi:hypothetical protein
MGAGVRPGSRRRQVSCWVRTVEDDGGVAAALPSVVLASYNFASACSSSPRTARPSVLLVGGRPGRGLRAAAQGPDLVAAVAAACSPHGRPCSSSGDGLEEGCVLSPGVPTSSSRWLLPARRPCHRVMAARGGGRQGMRVRGGRTGEEEEDGRGVEEGEPGSGGARREEPGADWGARLGFLLFSLGVGALAHCWTQVGASECASGREPGQVGIAPAL